MPSRTSLPQEFFDITDPMMLVQPEPQYWYALMLFAARSAAELKPSDIAGGIGLPGRQAGGGGPPVPSLSDMQLMLAQSAPAQAIKVNLSLVGNDVQGTTVRINRPVFSGGGFTQASRTISGRQAISTVPIDVTSEQVTLTLENYGGPYDTVNARVAPFAIVQEEGNRSVHSMASLTGLHMQRDRYAFLDGVLSLLFSQGATSLYGADPQNALGSANAAFLAAGDRPLDCETLYRVEESLANNKIPRFANGRYIAVLSSRQIRQLRSDPEFQDQSKFFKDENPLYQRYISTVGNLDIFECTTNQTGTANGSITYQIGTAFGPGFVGYAPGQDCVVRQSTDDNYGKLPKVIWDAYEAIETLDNRFGVRILTD